MKLRNYLIAGTLTLACSGAALAAVTQEEAKKLGTTLTEIGAEKAGNKEGTIPAYTGGITTPPANYVKGSGKYVDPYANEKPLFSINATNVAKYADKLNAGAIELIKTKPGYRIDVYPTHRSQSFPEYVRKGTVKVATTAKLINNGNGVEGAVSGYPFPIPKNGNEVMWNHLLQYRGEYRVPEKAAQYIIDDNGRVTLASGGKFPTQMPYWFRKNPTTTPYVRFLVLLDSPPRAAGQKYLTFDFLDLTKYPRQGYQYLVGQRRVKNAADLKYDAPNPTVAGTSTCDDAYVFNGPLDRFDYKLVGKKEMYVPYNTYKMQFESTKEQLFMKKFVNPDLVRWELHRVWVVESTVKPGQRHIYAKRTFYVDEDSWAALASDEYDNKGKLYRTMYVYIINAYDAQATFTDNFGNYDFVAGGYGMGPITFKEGSVKFLPNPPEKYWNPENLAKGAL